MRVRMKAHISGTRNGRRWPARGGEVELADAEGARLCEAGLAVPVADEPVETATAPAVDVETRDACDVEDCNYTGTPQGLKVHTARAHKPSD